MKYYIKISVSLTLLILLVFSSIRENSKVSKAERLNYENFLKEHPFNNRPHMSKRDWKKKYAKKDRPDLAAEQNFLMTLDPATGQVPRERLIQAFEQAEISKASRTVTVEWVEHGPDNVGGRTRAVMFDPNDSEGKKFWAGGVTGGLWFTDDITLTDPSWNKIDDFWDNIAISCIAYDPTNTQTFYIGTGEIYTGDIRGLGIWKTMDAGSTWSRLTSTNDFYWVNDIVVRNENGTGVVYVAAGDRYYQGVWHNGTEGLLRSTNGGVTFTQAWSGANATLYQPSDLEIDTNNNLWAGTRNNSWGSGGGQILKSSDGTTWSTVYTTDDANRMELACAPSNANVVYAVGSGGSGDDDIGVFVKSTDGGTTWTSVTIPLNWDNVHFTRGQAWYDLILAVAPDDATVIYAGGIDLHKSIDSGTNWTMLSAWHTYYANMYDLEYVHADQHSFAFRPGYPNTAIFGNDGGIHMTSDSGAVFTAKNSGYNVTQFYSTAIHPTTGEYYFLAGSQDNGTQQFTNASGIVSTYEVTGGDGAYCFIDQTDPNYQITSYIYNNWRISSDGGSSFSNLTDDNTGRFINPADYDDNADILYSAANVDSIKRIHDVSGSYYSDYMSVTLGAIASHIRASDYSANVIYVGTSSGSLYKISNANSSSPSSTEITGTSFPTAWISCIELGASDSEILVIFSNFGVISIWYSVDAGLTWVSKEGDLPDMPVRWALFNPDNRNEVILATDIGVWSTDDLSVSSPTWTASNSGLANVRVDMLQIRGSDGLVTAATYGRGLFSTDDFGGTNSPPIITSIDNMSINEDSTLTVLLSGTDPDGDNITYTGNADTVSVSVSISVDTLSITSSLNWNGSANITVYATDGTDADTTTFTLTVVAVNDPPVLAVISNITIDEDAIIDIVLTASDVEEDTLIFSATADTNTVLVNISDGRY